MFVYIWKHEGTPFYVGLTKAIGRTNPLNAGGRGWLCEQTLDRIGRVNVVTEIHTVATVKDGQALERSLILKYGRIQLGTGSLTNLRPGGDGTTGMTPEGRARTSARLRENNPAHLPEVRAKISLRNSTPEAKARMCGDANVAKRPEVRAKIKAVWDSPGYKERVAEARKGKPIHSVEGKETRRQRLLDPSNPMREYHKVLNTDPTIRAKRVAALQTPETRAKISAGLRKKWAERKAML